MTYFSYKESNYQWWTFTKMSRLWGQWPLDSIQFWFQYFLNGARPPQITTANAVGWLPVHLWPKAGGNFNCKMRARPISPCSYYYKGRSMNKLQNSVIVLVFQIFKNLKYTFCREFNSE